MKLGRLWVLTTAILLVTCLPSAAQKRKIIIDQDAAGPAGTDQQSILLLIQSPQTEVLGITVVTGDQWLKAEVAHTLRMLEIVPIFPLCRERSIRWCGEKRKPKSLKKDTARSR